MKLVSGAALALLVLAGCGSKKAETVEVIDGTATLGGKPAKITSCKAAVAEDGEVHYVVIELGLDTGDTVLVDSYDGSKLRKGGDTTKLDCSRNSSSSTSGYVGSSGWGKGEVGLTCATPDGELVLDATYDCGAKDRPSNRLD